MHCSTLSYANALFSSEVTKAIIAAPTAASDAADVHRYLQQVATSTLILGLCALPGYLAATAVIDSWGRRRLQLVGYAGMTASYVVCAVALRDASSASPPSAGAFYALYGLTFCCCNLVNVTTYVIPAEIFPTAIRATGHGLSAASGKVGAAIGASLMPAILAASNGSLSSVMAVSAAISLAGLAFTAAVTRESQHSSIAGGTGGGGNGAAGAGAFSDAKAGAEALSVVGGGGANGAMGLRSSSSLSSTRRPRLPFSLRGSRGTYSALLKAQAVEFDDEEPHAEIELQDDEGEALEEVELQLRLEEGEEGEEGVEAEAAPCTSVSGSAAALPALPRAAPPVSPPPKREHSGDAAADG